jgi:Tol biopolymer transport system component
MSAEPPSISSIQRVAPHALDRVVKTCLAKDPEDRWQSAGDVGKELKWIAEGSAVGAVIPGAAPQRKRREWLAWTVAALAIAAGAGAALLSRRAAPPAEELIRFTIEPPPGQTFVDTVNLAPDGRRVLFLLQDEGGKTSTWVRRLDRLESRQVPGTENGRQPFWSPDGREIAFFREGKLKRIGADGGPAQTVCESGSGFTGAWSREGTILFTTEFGAGIAAVPAAGGTPRPVTVLDEARGDVGHFYPALLPDGRHFVFVARNRDPEKTMVMLGSVEGKDVRPLFRADSAAIYADPGYLLFARDNALVAWGFDAARLRTVGDPRPVFENVRYGTEDNRLSVSAVANRVAYQLWSARRRLVWVDRKGRELGTLGAIGGYEDIRISPDGRRVAAALRDPAHGQNLDLWVLDAVRGTPSRVTSERTDEFNPAWFPDGERLVYSSDHAGFYDLYERPANGGAEKTLLRTKDDKTFPTVSADGNLLYGLSDGATWVRYSLPPTGKGSPRRLGGSRFSEEHPEISPDGRWTAYESSESGPREVYLEPFPEGPRRQVSVGGGETPIWRRDGAELFYSARNGVLMSVAIQPRGGQLEIGEPQPLFPIQSGISGPHLFRRPYDVTPDGERFLVIRRAADAEADNAVVVLNWTAALEGAR